MTSHSVAILYSQSLFAAGVESRLRCCPDLEVGRIDASQPNAVELLRDLCPQIVILDLNDAELTIVGLMSAILAEMPGVPIIGLDLRNHEFHLYRQERHVAATRRHLLETLFSLLPSQSGNGGQGRSWPSSPREHGA